MNRTLRLALAASALSLGAGCGTVHFDVPEGKRVKLLDADTPAQVTVERTVWYFAWGAVELSDTHTAPILQEYDLNEARFHTQYNAWDSIINVFTNLLSFSRRRIIIEGNPAKKEGS